MLKNINQYSLVSIIIPVYNRENIIEQTVNCAISQTYKNLEIIISDNYSTDDTWIVLERLAASDIRIKLIKNTENLGPVKNWKAALNAVRGEYCKILWSDDIISNGFIEECLSKFDEKTAFVLTGVKVFTNQITQPLFISKYQDKKQISTQDYLFDVLITNKSNYPVSPGAALFRSEDLLTAYIEEIPNNDNLIFKNFGAGNDLLFYLNTSIKYNYIKFVSTEWAYFRSHENSFTVSNSLDLYYEYSKLFFVRTKKQDLLNLLVSKIFLKKIFNKKFKNIYSNIQTKMSFFSLSKYILAKLNKI